MVKKVWLAISFLALCGGVARAHGDMTEAVAATAEVIQETLRALRETRKQVPAPLMIDVHMHYADPIPGSLTPAQVVELMDLSGVSRALVSSAPNEYTQRLYRHAPERFVPEAMPYETFDDVETWHRDQRFADIVEGLLDKDEHPYVSIGEFHLYRTADADSPVVERIVRLAAKHGLFLHAHATTGAVRKLFDYDPNARVLWAHAGSGNKEPRPTPAELEPLLAQYPRLAIELAHRTDIAPGGVFDPGWKALLLRYHDRVMLGTDGYTPQRWKDFAANMDGFRAWLALLPPDVAEDIARHNAQRWLANSTTRSR